MVDAFGASRIKVKPPERGIFPLDHDGECKNSMKIFLECLKDNDQDHFPCKNYSKLYLECRMKNNLMAKEDLKTLGFNENNEYYSRVSISKENSKEAQGYIAGLDVKPSNKKVNWK